MRPGAGITLARVTTFPDGLAGWSHKFPANLILGDRRTSATIRQARGASRGEGYWMIARSGPACRKPEGVRGRMVRRRQPHAVRGQPDGFTL